MATSAVLLYKAEKKVDEEKLKKWLQEQLQDSGIKVLKE